MDEKKSDSKTGDEALVIVWTTVGDGEAAERLAGQIVSQSTAACVQIDGPVRSFYRWRGELEDELEYRLLIKTRASKGEQLVSWLVEHHPYEEAEILVTPVTASSAGYRDWVIEQTGGRPGITG